MNRKVSEIQIMPYADTVNGTIIDCEPSADDVRQAISNQQLELRGYQADREALMSEWMQGAQSIEDWGRLVKSYHARRIAYFVVHGWSDPIVLTADGRLIDGLHRIKAAIHKGMEEVEINIAQ